MLQERKRGGSMRGESKAVSVDDRPYGRCYGQVCGMSYPCTQQEYISPRMDALEERKAENKSAKERDRHRGKRVRCPEIGATFSSMADAAKYAGVSKSTLRHRLSGSGKVRVNGYTFEVID